MQGALELGDARRGGGKKAAWKMLPSLNKEIKGGCFSSSLTLIFLFFSGDKGIERYSWPAFLLLDPLSMGPLSFLSVLSYHFI